ncbi:glycosyl hydrolase [Aspergillus pseudodeflectus]|uniref:Glycosyl hydrolase n=1 Tax=Aspergillus pseudodeflectus TaxID=176178 RepID=A0ABR4JBB4_9EURO
MNADFVCRTCWKEEFVLFKTANPYDDAAWTGPIIIDSKAITIDPDLFWDDDGKAYVASSGILLQSVDLETGETSEPVNIWNGTEMNHAVTISRSRDVWGPYESYAGNPILTNRNTSEYFQTVGHADLFQDVDGNWWGLALSTRSGPEWSLYPMGRESVLFPARWDKDEWPVLEPVRGRMRGSLPPRDRSIPGSGNWVDAGERLKFPQGSDLPRHLVHWRAPPNRAADYAPTDGQTFIARRQSHNFFEFSVDVSAHLTAPLQETGISLFLTSRQHVDLGIIMLPVPRKGLVPHIQLNTVAFGKPNATVPRPVVVPLPKQWKKEPIRLQVAAHDDRTFVFSASTPSKPHNTKILGSVGEEMVSGGSGPFTGSLLGAYATTNGGKKTFKSYISR